MLHVKKNDTVKILAGKDKGKTGKVLKILSGTDRAIVQGANFMKKHKRRTRQDDQGGIIEKEASIQISNLAVVCKSCNAQTRIGVDVLQDGTKVRYCKKCREVL